MTFNIRYGTADDGDNRWELRKALVFALIHEELPDILGVQEALLFQLDEIREAVPGYEMVGVGRDDGRTQGEYSAILYRSDRFHRVEEETFWFSDTPTIPGSTSWGNAITRICTWVRLVDIRSQRGLYVYNLHLDHISQPSREKSLALLVERIRKRTDTEPFVVMGDFNAGEENPAVRFLKSEEVGLTDTYRHYHPADSSVGTYHAFSGDRTGEKIDHIFVEPRTVVLDAAILHRVTDGRFPSDHFPVTARIRIK